MYGSRDIILIDDDPMFNYIHSKIIQNSKLEYRVQSFENASSALMELEKAMRSDTSELQYTIFVDINMPVIDGWGFLDRFQHLPESFMGRCKIFMLSSSNDVADVNRAATYSIVNGFISKPLSIQQVLDISSEEYTSIQHKFKL